MEIIEYGGWKRNVRLSNKALELVATLEVGPRIIRLAAPGGRNVFKNYDDQLGRAGEAEWQIRGGHRLWFAPEDPVATYFPDNGPVEAREIDGGVRLTPPPETPNGLQKELDVILDPRRPRVRVVHRLTSIGAAARTLAPWALSVMAPGGTAIVGLPKRGRHPRDLLPNQGLVLWPYTDLADPRLKLGTRAILLSQRKDRGPTKLGLLNVEGWAAYAVHGCLFVKRFACQPGATYPDMGVSTELFTNQEMLEVESLGPLVSLAPGQAVEHVEEWHLFAGVPAVRSEADAEAHVRPRLAKTF
jgi:hypothetical protein